MIAALVPHMPAAIAAIILFLFQMAKLEDSINTNRKIVVTRKRRKLTCEVQSIARQGQCPGC
jgi:hypothetical protein